MALELFKIGYSWGGVTSLAVAYDLRGNPDRPAYGTELFGSTLALRTKEICGKIWRAQWSG